MREAVAAHVRDGDTVVIEGFTHLICFAAGHEIIRQRRRDLTLCRLTPDLIYDQLIAAGCARKLVFSWAGNPGAGSLHAFRRAVEGKSGPPLELEEYSHFGMVGRAERRRGAAAVLAHAQLHGHRSARRQSADRRRSSVRTPVSAWPPCRRSIRTSPSSTRSAPTRRATPRSGACSACRRRRRSPRSRVIVVVEELVDERRHPRRSQPHAHPRASSWTPWCSSRGARIRRTPRGTTIATTSSTSRGRRSRGIPPRCRATWMSSCTACGPRRRTSGACGGLERLRADRRVCEGVNYGF